MMHVSIKNMVPKMTSCTIRKIKVWCFARVSTFLKEIVKFVDVVITAVLLPQKLYCTYERFLEPKAGASQTRFFDDGFISGSSSWIAVSKCHVAKPHILRLRRQNNYRWKSTLEQSAIIVSITHPHIPGFRKCRPNREFPTLFYAEYFNNRHQ